MFKSNFKSGVYYNLEEGVYRSDPALSTSNLKELGKSNPEHFLALQSGQIQFNASAAMELGSLFHMYILERGRWEIETIFKPTDIDYRTKVGKAWRDEHADKTIITVDHWVAIQAMAERYYNLPAVKSLVKPQFEVSAVAKDFVTGIDVKCRIDALDQDVVVDIKTTRAGGANPRKFGYTVRDLKYHWQQQNYTNILKANGRHIRKWYWAVIETEAPYDCAVYELHPQDMVMAEAELKEAYKTLGACLELNTWPNYTPTHPMTISAFGNV
jgi:hypothetical protein